MNWLDFISTSIISIPFVFVYFALPVAGRIYALLRSKRETHILALLQAEALFSSNVHFHTFYSLVVFYVLSQTCACKNFDNLINIKKVIDIYDYDYTLKALVGYNKLLCSISRTGLFHWLEQSEKNTHLPCFRQMHFFLNTYISILFIAYLYSTYYNKHVHIKILKI